MPRLIHLNGPSGVGKSTLARRYADEHAGTLVLDLDVLAGLVGGWEDNFPVALEVARGHAREMAARHLRAGYDVVLPQLVTVHDHAHDPALQEVAQAADATYIEVALLIDDQAHLDRLHGRRPRSDVQARIQAALVDPESDLVSNIRDHLSEHLAKRPDAIRLDATGLGEDATYHRLLRALEAA